MRAGIKGACWCGPLQSPALPCTTLHYLQLPCPTLQSPAPPSAPLHYPALPCPHALLTPLAHTPDITIRTWRHYLTGVHFEVHTDHNTLRHITTQPSLSQHQARWVEFISEFNFEIKYMKGKENVVVDALSRIPPSSPDADKVHQLNHVSCVDLTSWFLSQLKAAAKADVGYQRLVHHPAKHSKTVGGLLYCSVEGQLWLVVPQSQTLRRQTSRSVMISQLLGTWVTTRPTAVYVIGSTSQVCTLMQWHI